MCLILGWSNHASCLFLLIRAFLVKEQGALWNVLELLTLAQGRCPEYGIMIFIGTLGCGIPMEMEYGASYNRATPSHPFRTMGFSLENHPFGVPPWPWNTWTPPISSWSRTASARLGVKRRRRWASLLGPCWIHGGFHGI